MKQGYLVLRVAGIILMTVAGVLLAWDIAENYGQQIRDALPYGYYIFVIGLIIVGIILEIYASKREKGKGGLQVGGRGYK